MAMPSNSELKTARQKIDDRQLEKAMAMELERLSRCRIVTVQGPQGLVAGIEAELKYWTDALLDAGAEDKPQIEARIAEITTALARVRADVKIVASESVPSHPKTIPAVRRRKRAKDPEVMALYREIYKLHQANQGIPNIHLRICMLLDKNHIELPRPWRRSFSNWEDAHNSGFRRKVAKYISHAVKVSSLQLHR
jgi:hypothetical protein